MTHPRLFWLHIKKSAGQTTRRALAPVYTTTDRSVQPACFMATPRAEWNDVLNNHRVPLGRWQFRRCAFARRFLWPDGWDGMLRVAFARHPVARCVSMFHYLFDPFAYGRNEVTYMTFLRARRLRPVWRQLPWRLRNRLPWDAGLAFEMFLDALEWQDEKRRTGPNAAPFDLHFSTHTNPMSNDVLSRDGRLELTHLIRLDSFEAGIDLVYRELGVPRPPETCERKVNAGQHTGRPVVPTPAQLRRIETLFARDFDLYENALAP